jgi:hypothetical protein
MKSNTNVLLGAVKHTHTHTQQQQQQQQQQNQKKKIQTKILKGANSTD